jgi:hypothetical protein
VAENKYEDVYSQGKSIGNTVTSIGNIAGLVASTKFPGAAIPTMLGTEAAGEIIGHFGINKAIRETLKERGVEFDESASSPNALARSAAGALVSTGMPLGHAYYLAQAGKKELGSAVKGLSKSQALGAGYAKSLGKTSNLIASLLIPILGAYLAPKISKAIAGDPLEGTTETGETDESNGQI